MYNYNYTLTNNYISNYNYNDEYKHNYIDVVNMLMIVKTRKIKL